MQLSIASAHENYFSKDSNSKFDSYGLNGSYDSYLPLWVICYV